MGRGSSDEFRPDSFTSRVLNLDVTFHWIEGTNRLWFRRQARTGDQFLIVDAETGAQSRLVEPPTTSSGHSRGGRVVAPDGRSAIERREHDLWLEDLSFGNKWRRLTEDGEPHFGYGDVDPSYDRQEVSRRRAHEPQPLLGILWSPDSRFILALRQDLRPFPERLFITEYVSPDEGYARPHFRKMMLARDASAPGSKLVVIDTRTF